MAFVKNEYQQMKLTDTLNYLTERERKRVENSWAKEFAEVVFPAINEERFSVLYSDNDATRPNTPVNITIGAMILQERFGHSDEVTTDNVILNPTYRYALHATSFDEVPFSDRSLSRFRERLYNYELKTGINLIQLEMESLADIFTRISNMRTDLKRMDSVMISSNCKKMARLELFYTCVQNMVVAIHRTGEIAMLSERFMRYLEKEDKNNTIYRSSPESSLNKLDIIIQDAVVLLELCKDGYEKFPEYIALSRVIKDQTIEEGESARLKANKEVSPTSLQNPSDPDCTYRTKAGESHTGYVGHFVETVDMDKGLSIITQMDYQPNVYSDVEFGADTINDLGKQEQKSTLVGDGAYGSAKNIEDAKENNIELVPTCLTGVAPDPIIAEFVMNDEGTEIQKCPAGNTPIECTYNENTKACRVHFVKETCENCPNKDKCKAKIQQKDAVVTVKLSTIQRAILVVLLSTDVYKELSRFRNGVEAIPSLLRRKYAVDNIPTKGLLRSKTRFFLKLGAINVNRITKKVKEERLLANINGIIRTFINYLISIIIKSRYCIVGA